MKIYKTSKIVFDLVQGEIEKSFKVDKIFVGVSIVFKTLDGSTTTIGNTALNEEEVRQFNYLRINAKKAHRFIFGMNL